MTTTQAPQAHVNLSSAELIERAVARGEGRLSANGALVVNTGLRTGRSPKDRFIVDEPSTRSQIDWGSVNRPFDAEKFNALWDRVDDYLNSQEHFISELLLTICRFVSPPKPLGKTCLAVPCSCALWPTIKLLKTSGPFLTRRALSVILLAMAPTLMVA